MTSGSTSVTTPRVPGLPSSVVTAHAGGGALGLELAEEPLGRWPRRARSRPGSPGPAAPRPAGTAARCRTRRRPAPPATGRAGSRNGVPSGPTTSTWSPCRSSASHAVPAPCTATTNSRCRRTTPAGVAVWIENARRSSIPLRRAADRERDELTRAGVLGDAGRDQGQQRGRRRPACVTSTSPRTCTGAHQRPSSLTDGPAAPSCSSCSGSHADVARGAAPRCPARGGRSPGPW